MNKEELRQKALAERLAISASDLNDLSSAIFRNLLSTLSFTQTDCIHVFLPILSKNEINTHLFIKQLIPIGCKIVVPVSDFKSKEMKSALFTEDSLIESNQYGIPEPQDPIWVNDEEITHIITPLLAFDTTGNRVGYGGGFYDRFFANISPSVFKIGVALHAIYPEFEFSEPHDIKLDCCFTPEKTYHFDHYKT